MANYRVNNHIISIRERQLICNKSNDGIEHKEIAAQHELKESTINKYVARNLKNGYVMTEYEIKKVLSPKGKVERRKKLDHIPFEEYLLHLNTQNPTRSLENYRDKLFEQFGEYVCIKTIENFFKKKHKYTYKAISPLAHEANDTEQLEFWNFIDAIVTDVDQLVFLDEMHSSDKTANQTHGRGPKRVYAEISFSRGNYKFSLINIVWYKGVIDFDIILGGVKEEDFVEFIINKLINVMQPYPGPRSVLILDNIALHKTRVLQEISGDIGFILGWLPRYWPLGNLAEVSFRDTEAIEKSKGKVGEENRLNSLCDSVSRLRHKDYSSALRDIGYNM